MPGGSQNEPKFSFSKEFDRVAREAFRHYQKGRYEKAQELFQTCLRIDSRGEPILYPYMARCNKVISATWDPKNKEDREKYKTWHVALLLAAWAVVIGLHLFFRITPDLEGNILEFVAGLFRFIFRSARNFFTLLLFLCLVYSSWRLFSCFDSAPTRWRCKHCGHFTPYVDPNEPTFGASGMSNSCRVCGRSYPMPDVYWDGWQGMEYMYARHSVYEQEFYDEYSELKRIGDSLLKKPFPEKACEGSG